MNHIERMIDAAANRAQEGVRVCEDICRFYLGTKELSERFKELRHEIRTAVTAVSATVEFRDVQGDGNKFVDTEEELYRTSVGALFSANLHRATEGVRTLEEASKLISSLSGRFQAVRFSLYDLEKEVTSLLTGQNFFTHWHRSLYALVDEKMAGDRDLVELAEGFCAGGAKYIQLRMKSASGKLFLETAIKIREVCRRYNAMMIINDRPDIARLSGAQGLHLGQDDIPVKEARSLVGPYTALGLSVHSPDEMDYALSQSPDYIALGPFFGTSTKEGLSEAMGSELFMKLRAMTELPVVVIGGITSGNIHSIPLVPELSVAVVSALYGDRESRAKAEEFVSVLEKR